MSKFLESVLKKGLGHLGVKMQNDELQ